jgi:hypothetical protein
MKVSVQLHEPAALPPGKVPVVPNVYEDERVPESFWELWRREKPVLGTEPLQSSPQPVAIPIGLHPLPCYKNTRIYFILYLLIL